MKAITIHQPFAAAIMAGAKTREFRSWNTNYRGPLLIHAAATHASLGDLPADEFFFRAILGVVDLVGVEPNGDGFAWLLANTRPIDPIDYAGKTGFFNVPLDVLASRYGNISWLAALDGHLINV